jgi:MATE family multidrug resistance protein
LLGAVITMCARALAQFFYGLHRPMIVLIAAIAGNLTNLLGNWLLIFGNEALGVPALGVKGAAIATVIGTSVELAIPLCLFLGPKLNAELGTRAAWRPSATRLRELFKAGWAPALMHGNEMICWSIFMSGLVGGFGTNHNTASWIALRYMHMSFMPVVGISFAITAMVGKAMGAGDPALAQRRAWLGVKVAMVYMAFCAVAFALLREPLVELLIDDQISPADRAEVLRIGAWIMVVAACFQLFDALGIALVGALRGAGDTVVPGVVTMIFAWTLIVGGGLLMVHAFPQLGAVGPWISAAVYIIVFGLWAGHRFYRGKWKTIKLIKPTPAH